MRPYIYLAQKIPPALSLSLSLSLSSLVYCLLLLDRADLQYRWFSQNRTQLLAH